MIKKKAEATFNKKELAKSERYRYRVDLINALLDSEKQYTILEVDKILDEFMKGKVK